MLFLASAGAGVIALVRHFKKKRAAAAQGAPSPDYSPVADVLPVVETPIGASPAQPAPLPMTAAPRPANPLRPYIRGFSPRPQLPISGAIQQTVTPPFVVSPQNTGIVPPAWKEEIE